MGDLDVNKRVSPCSQSVQRLYWLILLLCVFFVCLSDPVMDAGVSDKAGVHTWIDSTDSELDHGFDDALVEGEHELLPLSYFSICSGFHFGPCCEQGCIAEETLGLSVALFLLCEYLVSDDAT